MSNLSPEIVAMLKAQDEAARAFRAQCRKESEAARRAEVRAAEMTAEEMEAREEAFMAGALG